MATINYYLDNRSVRADGTSPLKVTVSTKKGAFLFSINIFLTKNQWDEGLKLVKNHPKKVFLNNFLTERKLEMENAMLTCQKQHGLSIPQMKKTLKEVFHNKSTEMNQVAEAFHLVLEDNHKKSRTKELYNTTLGKIKSFSEDCLPEFQDITPEWLNKFDSWLMSECPSANARAIHMRNLRAVFNYAIDNEMTNNYPFRKFKIKKEATRKRALSVKQLRMLHDFPLEDWQKKYVDTFFLMFYLIGINAIDLLNAKPSQVVDGRLEYKREKTGTLYSIKLEPEALDIINKYKGQKYLLKFSETANYKHFMKRMNMCLDSIIPGCTSYWARHSIATMAAELDVPLDLIARMLGHTDPARKITLVYIDYNQKKVDKANRRVIDWLLYNKK